MHFNSLFLTVHVRKEELDFDNSSLIKKTKIIGAKYSSIVLSNVSGGLISLSVRNNADIICIIGWLANFSCNFII